MTVDTISKRKILRSNSLKKTATPKVFNSTVIETDTTIIKSPRPFSNHTPRSQRPSKSNPCTPSCSEIKPNRNSVTPTNSFLDISAIDKNAKFPDPLFSSSPKRRERKVSLKNRKEISLQKAKKRRQLNRLYTFHIPNQRVPTPIGDIATNHDPYIIDPYNPDHRELSINFIEKSCQNYMEKALLPAVWNKKLHGKTTIAGLRMKFRNFFLNTVQPEMAGIYDDILGKNLIMRDVSDLKDQGKVRELCKFWVECIHPLWLILAIEAVLGQYFDDKAYSDTRFRKTLIRYNLCKSFTQN